MQTRSRGFGYSLRGPFDVLYLAPRQRSDLGTSHLTRYALYGGKVTV
jgi:hypothetical protein